MPLRHVDETEPQTHNYGDYSLPPFDPTQTLCEPAYTSQALPEHRPVLDATLEVGASVPLDIQLAGRKDILCGKKIT